MGKQRKYTGEFKKQIVEPYKNGKTAIELVCEYGLVEQTIYRYSPVAKDENREDISNAEIITMKKQNRKVFPESCARPRGFKDLQGDEKTRHQNTLEKSPEKNGGFRNKINCNKKNTDRSEMKKYRKER